VENNIVDTETKVSPVEVPPPSIDQLLLRETRATSAIVDQLERNAVPEDSRTVFALLAAIDGASGSLPRLSTRLQKQRERLARCEVCGAYAAHVIVRRIHGTHPDAPDGPCLTMADPNAPVHFRCGEHCGVDARELDGVPPCDHCAARANSESEKSS